MAPPVGAEINVRDKAYVTSHNEDGTFNYKKKKKAGAPYKGRDSDLVPPAVPLMAAVPAVPQEPTVPQVCDEQAPARGSGRAIVWGIASVVGAIGVGIFHGIGARVLDAVWPYIERLFPSVM